MKQLAALATLFAAAALVAGSSRAEPRAACLAARVNYTPYGGGDHRLDDIAWVGGTPGRYRLRGLLWYWPPRWREQHVGRVRIYLHGKAPQGWTTKILWAFLGEPAKTRAGGELIVRGQRLDGRGTFTQRFGAIGYDGQDGAPSYASIIDVPKPGCWRLQLTTGQVRSTVVFRAVRR
jgi:hypothetical protein